MNDTESMRIQCPHCEKRLRVPAKAAGKGVRCPQCSKQVDVPVQSDFEEESPAPAASRLLWLWSGGGAVLVLLIGLGIWLISGSKKQPEPSDPTQVAAGPTNPSNPVAPAPKKEPDTKPSANPEKSKKPEKPPAKDPEKTKDDAPAAEMKVADQPRPTTKQAQEAIDELFKWVVPFGEAKSFFSDQIHEALDGVRKVGATEAAVNRLVEILKNKSGMHRIRALLTLEMLGLDSKPAVPVLVELMKQKMTPGRVTTIQDEIWSSYFPRVLAVIGAQAKAAVPTLREALKDDVMRLDAVRALWRIEGQAADLVPLLVKVLKDPKPTNPYNPPQAASILGEIGSKAKEAVPALREALSQKNVYLRCNAALALWKIEKKTEDGVPMLIDIVKSSLNDTDPITGQVAAQVLGEIGPDAKVAVPALRDALKSKGARLRIAAALALWKVDQRNTESVPCLMKELSNQSTYPWDRKDAAKAMGVIGPQAKDAIPSLQQALKDNYPDVSKAAARAIERIQADPSQK